MNIEEYTKAASRTCPDLGSDFFNELHMAMGIATEAGELLDAYKKNFAYKKILDKTNVAEEIGDIFWYTFNLCRMFNINPEDIMENNIKKLKARFPEKFTEENAINRNLDRERQILEELGF
jgi:NTP pyrophosphatase (non-canonical NTP hydrolase)